MNIILISNIIGFFALSIWVASIQLKEKNKIMKTQLLANVFYAIQYFLLGAITAGSMNIVSTIRYYIYNKNEEKGKKNTFLLLIIFITIIMIIARVTFTELLHLIPIAITLLYTYITWQKNTKIIRIGFLIAAFIWIYYNFKVGAYISVVGNIFEIISGITAIYRLDIKKPKNVD